MVLCIQGLYVSQSLAKRRSRRTEEECPEEVCCREGCLSSFHDRKQYKRGELLFRKVSPVVGKVGAKGRGKTREWSCRESCL